MHVFQLFINFLNLLCMYHTEVKYYIIFSSILIIKKLCPLRKNGAVVSHEDLVNCRFHHMPIDINLLWISPKNFIENKSFFVSSVKVGEILLNMNFFFIGKAVNNTRWASLCLLMISWSMKSQNIKIMRQVLSYISQFVLSNFFK